MDDMLEMNQNDRVGSGPLISVIVIMLMLCGGAGYVFISKRFERTRLLATPSVLYSTTTIDLGTTTIQQ